MELVTLTELSEDQGNTTDILGGEITTSAVDNLSSLEGDQMTSAEPEMELVTTNEAPETKGVQLNLCKMKLL